MDAPFRGNLLAPPTVTGSEEVVQTIDQSSHTRIERIISNGQCSPPGFWYDQDEHEWVTVISGQAMIRFDDHGDESTIHLKPGDHLMIEAHRRHRVEWTDTEEPTIWIAVFYDNRPDKI
ncbi:cupin domain-containing protein [Rhodopirellula sp. SWK7]|uniref:cupin domain-containing protein n=1 Tax=Rhodopirellula sp. SWK7 TaxID=595460 RepID=UPI0002BFEAE3|nr:cupin domain-containing protein [Rhodopirellula sp. SWK7]EMI41403.1 Cupin 2 conserved barrel domain protein [Rhodopirellula sp. SWK7]